MTIWDNKKLRLISRQRRTRRQARPLNEILRKFLNRKFLSRQRNLFKLGQAWRELLPPGLVRHSCLESLHGGNLRVLVDDAASMYELQLLDQEELLEQLRQFCSGTAITQIKYIRGQWYRLNEDGIKNPDYIW